MVRLTLPLGAPTDWLKVFDPRGGGLFVPTVEPPSVGTAVRVDLTIADGGPRVILRGSVVWRRAEGDSKNPPGCSIGLSFEDREKINFLNGFVRGGLLNRRERRRLPLRLPVTYGAIEGPRVTHTRDINEEGIFIVSESPLPEETQVQFVLTVPQRTDAVSLRGVVSHTVIVEDEDVPGMGIRYALSDEESLEIKKVVDELEAAFLTGQLPEDVIT